MIDRATEGYVRIYLNGTLILEERAAVRREPALDSNRLVIGQYKGANGFVGEIDDVAIWNTVRTAGEIAADFADGASGDPSELAAHWDFDDLFGTVAADRSGNGNDAVLGASTVGVIGPSVATEMPERLRVVREGESLVINAPYSDAGTGDTHSAVIDWGDTTSDVVAVVAGIDGAGTLTAEHVYADNGVYAVTVTLTDDDDDADSDSFVIDVLNSVPQVLPGASVLGDEGQLIVLNDVVLFDPGALDSLSGTINWGDGTPTEVLVIDAEPYGPPGALAGLTGSLGNKHGYADDGAYTVTFTLEDDDGGVAVETLSLLVTIANVDPVVDAWADTGVPVTVNEGEPFALVGATFRDGGTLDTHVASIDWGDGTEPEAGVVSETPSGPPGSIEGMSGTVDGAHTYVDDGEYLLTLTVSDDDGGIGNDTQLVTVLNVAPTVDAGEDRDAIEGDLVSISAGFTDPGASDLHTALIDWGDGSVTVGSVDQVARTVSGDHVYADSGAFVVTISVSDNGGAVGEDSFGMTVANVAPVIDAEHVGHDALSFDGGDHVDVADSESLALTESSTVEVRLKVDPAATGRAALLQKSTDGLGENLTFGLWVDQGTGQLELGTQDESGVQSWSTAIGLVERGRWYDLASVIDRTTGDVRIYLNGEQLLDGSAAVRSDPARSSNWLVIGYQEGVGVQEGLVGVIDDVAIWKTVRSAADIAADFAIGVDDADTDLAAHWAFNEPDGDIAFDSSTFGNHGVLGASTVNVVGPSVADEAPTPVVRGALSFDGNDRVDVADRTILVFDGDDHVDVADSASLALTGSSTVEVRFKVDPAAAGWAVLVQKSDDGTGSPQTYMLAVHQSTGALELDTADPSGRQISITAPGLVERGQWYDLAAVIDRTTGDVRIYLNGALVLDDTAAVRSDSALASNRMVIGGPYPLYGLSGFVGAIDDVAIWNTVRSAAEIAADFATGVDDADKNLAGHWAFDEPSGNTALDASTYRNDGVLGGTVGATEVPTRDALLLTGSSTVEVRFKVDPAAVGWTVLVRKSTDGTGANRTYSLFVNPSTGGLFMSTRDASGDQFYFSPTGLVEAGKWYELATVIDRDTGSMQMYLDGVLVIDEAVAVRSAPALVSNLLVFSQNGFAGVIEDVAIWNTARSAAEIAADFDTGVDDTDVNLVGHWAFEETSGNIAIDASTYGNDGLLGGGVDTQVPLRVRPGELVFDGNDHVDVDDSKSLALTGSSTVEVRFRSDSSTESWKALVQKSTDGLGSDRAYTLWLNQSSGTLELDTYDTQGLQYWLTSSGLVETGQWYDLAAVIDRTRGDVKIYLNGALVLDQTAAVRSEPALSSNRLVIGGPLFSYSGFVGAIDDVAIWNTVRTAEEIAADFAGGASGAPDELASHWDFDDLYGTVATDRSSNGNDAVLGASTVTAPGPSVATEMPARVPARREGDLVVLSAPYSDAGIGDTHSATIDWGDTTSDVVDVVDGIDGAGTLTAEHVYADNGVYTVTVTLTDDDGGVDSDSFVIDVQNAAPQLLLGESQGGDEGLLIELTDALLFDPGTLDTHSGTIDWGDGSPADVLVIDTVPDGPPGSVDGLVGSLHGSHVYADDGVFTATFTLQDDDGGLNIGSFPVTVTNVAPKVDLGDDFEALEGDLIRLDPTVIDPAGVNDSLVFDWQVTASNGQPIPPGNAGTFEFTTFDNGFYTITLTVTDDDGGVGSDELIVTVLNVAPTVGAVTVTPVDILKGDSVNLSGDFSDPVAADTHTLFVDWGDGTVDEIILVAGARNFAVDHVYSDSGLFTVAVAIEDDDGGIGNAVAGSVTVNSRVPAVTVNTAAIEVNEGDTAVNSGTYSDPDGDAVSLTASIGSVIDEGGGNWSWSFDTADGPAESQTVTITATDSDDAIGTASFDLTVQNLAPALSLLNASAVNENDLSTVTGSIFDAGTGDAFTLSVDWGDGTPVETFNYPAGITGFSEIHRYLDDDPTGTAADSYTISVTLADDDLAEDIGTTAVTVTNVAPTLSGVSATDADEGALSTLTGSIADPGTLDTFTLSVNWGDGSLVSTYLYPAGTTTFAETHTYASAGSYTILVSVEDDDLGQSEEVNTGVTIIPPSTPPVAEDDSYNGFEDTTLTVSAAGGVLANDSDVDPTDTVTVSTGPVTNPANGTVTVNADGSFKYVPNKDYFGTDTFTYQAIDSRGLLSGVAEVTITIAPDNDVPVTADDEATVAEAGSIDIDVLDNDTDVDSALTYANVKVLTGPANGTAVVDASGITYTHNGSETTSDSFTYRIDDGAGGEDAAKVAIAITPENDPPVLGAIGNQTIDEGVELTFTATATDVDIPANTLTFSLGAGAPAGAGIDPGTGVFTWTPSEAQGPDTYTFDVVVTDNGTPALSDSETITVTINDVNAAPVLDAIGDQTVDEGVELTFTATVTDVDIPANSLTFSLAGTVPTGAGITSAGLFSWTPTETQGSGTYIFDVVVTDDGTPELNDSETITVTVNKVNSAPVLNPIGDHTVDEGIELTFTATAGDTDIPKNTLTFSLGAGAPAGASIDPDTGVFTWTPAEDEGPGTHGIEVVVTDNGTPALSDSETITVTVNEVNVAPVLNPIGNQSVDEGVTLTFTATASDADIPANTFTFSLGAGAPAGAGIDPVTGLFTWTPAEDEGPGTYEIEVVVSDGSETDAETITVTVNVVNAAPVLDPIGDQTIDEGVELTFTGTAGDTDIPANTLTFSLGAGAPTGAGIDPVTGAFTWTPAEDEGPGSYGIEVVVTDNGNPALSDSETITVTVNEVNVAPVLDPIGDQTIDEGVELTFMATAGDTDIPANALTFSLGAGAPVGAGIDPLTGVFTWTPTEDQGPGTHGIEVVVTDNGTPTLNDSETITVTVNEVNVAPSLDPIGDHTVDEGVELTFTATAGDTDISANTLTFSLGAGAPVGAGIDPVTGVFTWTPAEDQGPGTHGIEVVVTDNGTPALSDSETITVTVNEVNVAPSLDPIGDHTVDEGVELTFTATASDADSPANTLTFTLGAGAPAGAGIDPVTGVFSWTPNEVQESRTYTFDVVVTDDGTPDLSDSETVTVTVTKANAAPVLDPIGDQSVDEGFELTFTATATDVDIPANTLTFSLGAGAPAGAGIDPVTGVFSWNTTEGEGPGKYEIEVVVTDDGTPTLSDSEIIAVTVNEVNVAPILDPIGGQIVDEGVELTFTATASDTDTPANTLTFSLGVGAPASAAIDPVTGVFTWIPTESQSPGTYGIEVVVTDNGTPARSDSETITVSVSEANAGPVLAPIGDQTIDEGDKLTFTATANDVDLPANTLTFSLGAGAPAGASIDPGTGVFTWTPAEGEGPRTYGIEVVVTDDGTPARSDSETITVTVNEVNADPILDPIGDQTVDEGNELTFTATATDADIPANALTFSLAGAVPVGATIDPGTGVFTWIPAEDQGPGSYTFNVVVTDDGTPALVDSETITITVNEVNKAPVLDAIGDHTVDERNDLTFTATATDTDLPANTLTFTLSGAVPAGATIDLLTGVFTWTPSEAQGPGVYTIEVSVSDGTEADSETITVTVNEVDELPVLENWRLFDDSGISDSDKLTNDTTPILLFEFNDQVYGENSHVIVLDPDGVAMIPTRIDGWGSDALYAVFETPLTLDGTYPVTLSGLIQDPEGNYFNDNVDLALDFFLDTTAPDVTVDSLLTNNPNPSLTGTVSDAAASVEVTVDRRSYPATVNPDGTWVLSVGDIDPLLSDGVYDVFATATDPAGNVAVDSTNNELTLDTTAPVVTVDFLEVDDTTPAVTGTVDDPAAGIEIVIDGQTYAALNNGNGNWILPDDSISPALAVGTYNVAASATDAAGNVGNDTTVDELIILSDQPLLRIMETEHSASGVGFKFNYQLDMTQLNLYDTAAGTYGEPDLTLIGDTTGPVSGSIVYDPETRSVTFAKTGGPLAPDTYTLTLRGASNGFVDSLGNLLDGDGDATAGGDYVTTFTVDTSDTRLVSLPDFTRGPGQAVNVPAPANGIPVTISDGTGVQSVDLVLTYDPDLLNVTGISRGSGAPADWQVIGDLGNPGRIPMAFFGPTSLPAGEVRFLEIEATVPDDAPYAESAVLSLTNLQINEGAIAAQADSGVQVVAYFGDATGNHAYSALDAAYIARASVGLDSGFAAAFRMKDPVIIGDISGNGGLGALDAARLAQKIVGLDVTTIPDLPGTLPPIVVSGRDPLLSIADDLTASPGDTLNVPVSILDDATGLLGVDLTIHYDTNVFDVTHSDVSSGTLTAGWFVVSNVDDVAGTIAVSMFNFSPVPGGTGSVAEIEFDVRADAPAGPTALDITDDTALNEGELVLTIDDGAVTILADNQAPTIDALTVNPDPIAEDGTLTLDGTFSDLDSSGTFVVTVLDWGDGSGPDTLSRPPGSTDFSFTHQYLDDPDGTGPDEYTITVAVEDDTGQTTTGQVIATVVNIAPTVGNLGVTGVVEGSAETLTGTITDPGTLDTFTLSVDWGDETPVEKFNYPAGTTAFGETHVYTDDGAYTITAIVTDDDTGTGSDSLAVTVANVAPTLSADGDAVATAGEVYTLLLNVADPGNDTIEWVIDWGDGPEERVSGNPSSVSHLYTEPTPLPGDLDVNGSVDADDYPLFRQHYRRRDAAGRQDGDFNGDGVVDLRDYGLLRRYKGTVGWDARTVSITASDEDGTYVVGTKSIEVRPPAGGALMAKMPATPDPAADPAPSAMQQGVMFDPASTSESFGVGYMDAGDGAGDSGYAPASAFDVEPSTPDVGGEEEKDKLQVVENPILNPLVYL